MAGKVHTFSKIDQVVLKTIEINSIAWELEEIAKAFHRLGDYIIARELKGHAINIKKATRSIRDHRENDLLEAEGHPPKNTVEKAVEELKNEVPIEQEVVVELKPLSSHGLNSNGSPLHSYGSEQLLPFMPTT
jgi:hypothetical protein